MTSYPDDLGWAVWGDTEIETNTVTLRAESQLGCVNVQTEMRDFLNVSAYGRGAKRS